LLSRVAGAAPSQQWALHPELRPLSSGAAVPWDLQSLGPSIALIFPSRACILNCYLFPCRKDGMLAIFFPRACNLNCNPFPCRKDGMPVFFFSWASILNCSALKGPYIPFRFGWHPSQLPVAQKGPYPLSRHCESRRFSCRDARARNANDIGTAESHASAPRRRIPDPTRPSQTARWQQGGSRLAAGWQQTGSTPFHSKKAQDSAQFFISFFTAWTVQANSSSLAA
jgi:hypothetical protein